MDRDLRHSALQMLTWIVLADPHVRAEVGHDVLIMIALEEPIAPCASDPEVQAIRHDVADSPSWVFASG